MTKLEERIKNAPEDTVKESWVHKLSPDFAWPYLQLMRADRPIGTWLLLWPCLWSIVLASHYHADPGLFANWDLMVLFAVGAFLMRGAGCVVNDLWDREADALVERTKSRPIPSGRVSVTAAIIFTCVLSLIGLIILLQLNPFAQTVGAVSLILVVIYPLMKRITYWPQLMLGFTFNWGALMGWAAVSETIEFPALLLYAGGIFWTLGYDTIYACQDKEDDERIGVKSTALRFGEKTDKWISFFYLATILFFISAGWFANVGLSFYIFLILAALHLVYQVVKLDIDNRETCLKLFKSNSQFGLLVFLSILSNNAF